MIDKCREYRQDLFSNWRLVNNSTVKSYSRFTDARLTRFQRVKWRCQQAYKRPACSEMTDKCREYRQDLFSSWRQVYSVKPMNYSRFTDARLAGVSANEMALPGDIQQMETSSMVQARMQTFMRRALIAGRQLTMNLHRTVMLC